MTASLWAAVALVALVLVIGWRLMRQAIRADRSRNLEAENEIRNKARDARHRLDDDERKRLRERYGK